MPRNGKTPAVERQEVQEALLAAQEQAETERATAVQEMEDWRWFMTRITEAREQAPSWEDLFRVRGRRGV